MDSLRRDGRCARRIPGGGLIAMTTDRSFHSTSVRTPSSHEWAAQELARIESATPVSIESADWNRLGIYRLSSVWELRLHLAE